MENSNELKEEQEILRDNLTILFFWVLGILFIIFGGVLLGQGSPAPEAGLPLLALGFAFVTYGLNSFSNAKNGRKLDRILKRIDKSDRDLNELTSTVKIGVNTYQNPSIEDIDTFCKSVLAWKVAASKKSEMFDIFRDNPYYLMGFLTYITQKNIEESKTLQKEIRKLTIVALFFSCAAVGFTIITALVPLHENSE